MSSTTIQWTDVSWNPVRGCSLVSAGCQNCYAMKQAHRFSGPGQPYEGLTEIGPHGPRWSGSIRLVPEALEMPLHWRKPRRIFVNSMSDLFHEDVPFTFIHQVFATIRQTPHHVYQILTKRPERMLEVMNLIRSKELLGWAKGFYSHVWLGVSVEDQATADERIPILLQTPAAVRWISAEPLLGPVDIRQWLHNWGCSCGWGGEDTRSYCMDCGWRGDEAGAGECCPSCNRTLDDSTACRDCDNTTRDGSGFGPNTDLLDWVVVGGESGPRARPCDLVWIRSIKEQCEAAAVPVFVKQLGTKPYAVEGSVEAKEWGAFDQAVAAMDDGGRIHCRDRKGGAPSEWPKDLRVREWPR